MNAKEEKKERKRTLGQTAKVLDRFFAQGRITRRQRLMAIPADQWEEAMRTEEPAEGAHG